MVRFDAPPLAIDNRGVYPRPVQERLPIWIAVGGTPQSVTRAGTLGLPLALAIIGGYPEKFAPLVDLYRESGRRAGHDPATLKVSTHLARIRCGTRSEQAANEFFPPYAEVMSRVGQRARLAADDEGAVRCDDRAAWGAIGGESAAGDRQDSL